MVDIAQKHKNAALPMPGMDTYPAYNVDRNSTIIWQKNGEPNALLKVGYTQSMDRIGLHGYLTGIDVGKSYYMLYIVEPGTYSLIGNTYKLLARTSRYDGKTVASETNDRARLTGSDEGEGVLADARMVRRPIRHPDRFRWHLLRHDDRRRRRRWWLRTRFGGHAQ